MLWVPLYDLYFRRVCPCCQHLEPLWRAADLSQFFDPEDYNDPNDPVPTTGASGAIKLGSPQGTDYGDSRWEELLDQVAVEHVNFTRTYLTSCQDGARIAVQGQDGSRSAGPFL